MPSRRNHPVKYSFHHPYIPSHGRTDDEVEDDLIPRPLLQMRTILGMFSFGFIILCGGIITLLVGVFKDIPPMRHAVGPTIAIVGAIFCFGAVFFALKARKLRIRKAKREANLEAARCRQEEEERKLNELQNKMTTEGENTDCSGLSDANEKESLLTFSKTQEQQLVNEKPLEGAVGGYEEELSLETETSFAENNEFELLTTSSAADIDKKQFHSSQVKLGTQGEEGGKSSKRSSREDVVTLCVTGSDDSPSPDVISKQPLLTTSMEE